MDRAPFTGQPEEADVEQADPGIAMPKNEFECPTCGDHFPSQAALDEHLPEHKTT
jgi:hypothetical protein